MTLKEDKIEEFLYSLENGNNPSYVAMTTGETYDEQANIYMIVKKSNKAKNIRYFNMREQEVLYPRGSKFIILKKVLNGKVLKLELEEAE